MNYFDKLVSEALRGVPESFGTITMIEQCTRRMKFAINSLEHYSQPPFTIEQERGVLSDFVFLAAVAKFAATKFIPRASDSV